MTRTLGIDLGTTFSLVATIDADGSPRILKNSQGESSIPSVIYFGDGEPVVGNAAKNMQLAGESEIASFFKRSMGKDYFALEFGGRIYNPTDLSVLVLSHIKAEAEKTLGEPVKKAVITVPAYFNNAQRQATIQAAQQAGLEVMRIINEPTAAALAYGLHKTESTRHILVYDLGGGTFDVTLVKIAPQSIEVIATDGYHELGGKDWDDRVLSYISSCFLQEYGIDPLDELDCVNDLLVRCENVKKQLSFTDSTRITVNCAGIRAIYELSREAFEKMTRDLMERTELLTEAVIKEAGLQWSELDGVLLVGGSTHMPMVSSFVEKMSGKKALTGINPDEAVAMGAAIQAYLDEGETAEEAPVFTIGGQKRMQDVISHSLGMIAINEDRSRYINSIIIPKNRPIPCVETRPFQLPTRPGSNTLEVYMLQGESEQPLECYLLGKYLFSDIKHRADKPAVIDISYAYDRNGVVNVSARDRINSQDLPLVIETLPDDMSWLSRPPAEKMKSGHASILIAVDLSGSMEGNRLHEAKKAATRFIEDTDLSHSSIGLILFADQCRMIQDLSQNAKKLSQAVSSWKIGEVGYCNEAEPFSQTLTRFRGVEGPRFLIVLTDGMWENQQAAVIAARKCHDEGIEIIAIGIGAANEDFLEQVATSNENALLTDLDGLVSSFSKIAQVLTETGGGIQIQEEATERAPQKIGLLRFFK